MSPVVPRPWTLLVTHADPLLCAGLSAALREHSDFETFVGGLDGAASQRPRIDVVITDYDSAMRLAGSLRRAHDTATAPRLLILTTNDREADIRRAIEAGVHGYILSGGPLAELIEGTTMLARGLRFLSPSVAQRMADSLTRTPLTSREIQVLSLAAVGEPNKAIARELRIGMGTVKSHMTSIMSKLGARSRTQVAGIAATRGLIDPHAATLHLAARRRAGTVESRLQLA
jgi:two-component system NarL family response regulator